MHSTPLKTSRSRFCQVPFKFTWRLDDYLEKARFVNCISSPPFSVFDPLGRAKSARFQLTLYPNGFASSPNLIGLIVTSLGAHARVAFSLYMLNERGEKVCEQTTAAVFPSLKNWGYLKYCAKWIFQTNADKVSYVMTSSSVRCYFRIGRCSLKLHTTPLQQPLQTIDFVSF
jgi:hypothetical protein